MGQSEPSGSSRGTVWGSRGGDMWAPGLCMGQGQYTCKLGSTSAHRCLCYFESGAVWCHLPCCPARPVADACGTVPSQPSALAPRSHASGGATGLCRALPGDNLGQAWGIPVPPSPVGFQPPAPGPQGWFGFGASVGLGGGGSWGPPGNNPKHRGRSSCMGAAAPGPNSSAYAHGSGRQMSCPTRVLGEKQACGEGLWAGWPAWPLGR